MKKIRPKKIYVINEVKRTIIQMQEVLSYKNILILSRWVKKNFSTLGQIYTKVFGMNKFKMRLKNNLRNKTSLQMSSNASNASNASAKKYMKLHFSTVIVLHNQNKT